MKKVTGRYREAIKWIGLNERNWLIKQAKGGRLLIKHKESGNEREIPL